MEARRPDKGLPEWKYKGRALHTIANCLAEALSDDWLDIATLVPVPPSKDKGDPEYDDRMVRMLKSIQHRKRLDVQELVLQDGSRIAAHEAEDGCRPRPEDLRAGYVINEDVAEPPPLHIGIFDDLLVTGASFKAMQSVLTARFPGANIVGVFVARRAPESDFDALDINFDPAKTVVTWALKSLILGRRK